MESIHQQKPNGMKKKINILYEKEEWEEGDTQEQK